MARRSLDLARLVAAGLALVSAVGCTEKVPMPTDPTGGPGPGPGGPPMTPDSIQAIFTARCIGCHSGGSPAAGMDLSAGHSYESTVDVPSAACAGLDRIEPNDPANSCLVRRIEGSVPPRMPLGGTGPLPAADIAKIRSWISQGAPGVVSGPVP
jgi:hypothetical protein